MSNAPDILNLLETAAGEIRSLRHQAECNKLMMANAELTDGESASHSVQ